MRRFAKGVGAAMLAAALATAPAGAQMFSDSFNFIKAVRDRKAEDVMKYVDRPSILDTKAADTGEAALHILVKRRDTEWLTFMLAKGAKPDVRDRDGNTPIAVAALVGFPEGAQLLVRRRANVNLANNRGETPLILAVQKRDLEMVRLLLASGADPRTQDRIAGMSAHDYAVQDRRSAVILKALDEAKPAATPAPKQGPGL